MTAWLRLAPYIAALALACGVWAHGYRTGAARADARHEAAAAVIQKRLFAAADEMSRQAAEIEAYRAAQAAMVQEMEDAAEADPGACRLSDAARVRLRARWNAAED